MSEESKAFHKCSAHLIKEILYPELLAWELYSSGVISKKQVEEMSMVMSVMQKKTRLLIMIEDQIAINPSNFQNLLKVLRKQPTLNDVVSELRATYKSCLKVGGIGMQGLSC